MKAHTFRELVNDLRDIATQWHGSQQLRCGVVITQNCGSLNWEHDDDPSDIIAYRIVRK